VAANQLKSPSVVLGHLGANFSNDTTLGLSAAATWLALQVVPQATKTLSKVRLFLDTKTGTPTAAGCTCDLYADASGIPGASSEGPIAADSVPASGNWMQWTFAGTSVLTGGTPYWLVFKNGTGTPASNFPTYRYQVGVSGGATPMPFQGSGLGGSGVLYGWNKVHTLNSGTAWASGLGYGATGLRLEYTDGTFEGLPVQTGVRPSTSAVGDRAFGKSEVGVRFNLPSGATFNVLMAGFPLIKVSTPGDLRFRLYQGVTLLATSAAIPAADVTTATGDWYFASFPSAQAVVSTSQPFRLTFGDATAADANTKGYNAQVYTFDGDANSLALKPMNGSVQKTVTADNTAAPVVFTDTAADVIPFALLLSTNGELTAAGGGVTPTRGIITGGRL
jgi:hypothetical protein